MKIIVACIAAVLAIVGTIFVAKKTTETTADPVPHVLETVAAVAVSEPLDPIVDPMEEVNEKIVDLMLSKSYTLSELDELVQERNEIIDDYGFNDIKLGSAQELVWLCKLITAEAGSDYICDEQIELTTAVVFNRLRSSGFPNTISKVIFQDGQYQPASSIKKLDSCKIADRVVRIVFDQLDDHRICPANVVFQSNRKQGSGIYKTFRVEEHKDTLYEYTYFGYDNYARPCYADDPYYLP